MRINVFITDAMNNTSNVKVCAVRVCDSDTVLCNAFVLALVRLQTVSNLQWTCNDRQQTPVIYLLLFVQNLPQKARYTKRHSTAENRSENNAALTAGTVALNANTNSKKHVAYHVSQKKTAPFYFLQ